MSDQHRTREPGALEADGFGISPCQDWAKPGVSPTQVKQVRWEAFWARLRHRREIYKSPVKTLVLAIPDCDVCYGAGQTVPAYAEAWLAAHRRGGGMWAYVCRWHFDRYDCQLGLGTGQELVLPLDQRTEVGTEPTKTKEKDHQQ
jgi:hypothetical protein